MKSARAVLAWHTQRVDDVLAWLVSALPFTWRCKDLRVCVVGVVKDHHNLGAKSGCGFRTESHNVSKHSIGVW